MTSRAWCFTVNNPENERANGQLFDATQPKHLRYACWQKEAGASGTVHLQGYMEFTQPVRLSALRASLHGAHLEPRRGTREQARDYCRKPDRLDGPWEWGEWSAGGQGKRTELADACAVVQRGGSLCELAAEYPVEYVKYHRGFGELRRRLAPQRRRVELKVYLIWGKSGVGKTRLVHDLWGDEVYALASQKPLWFDGYDGEKVLLIDEFEGVHEFGREKLLRVLDIYPYDAPVKGGHVRAQWTKVYITSNNDLEYEFKNCAALWRRVTKCEYVE